MANNTIIVCIVSILFCSFVIHKLNQQDSYLIQLKSSLETVKSTYTSSIMEKRIFDINDEDIAKFENINIQLAQMAASLEKQKNQGWIPALKNELLTFMSSLKSYLHFLTSKISEVSLISINTLVTIFQTFQRSAIPFMKIQLLNFISTPFIKESYNSAIHMSTSLLFGNVKGLNDFFHFCLEAARWYWNH